LGAGRQRSRDIYVVAVALKWVHRLWVILGLMAIVAATAYKGTRPGAGRDIEEFRSVVVGVVAWLVVLIALSVALSLRQASRVDGIGPGSAAAMLHALATHPERLPKAYKALAKMGGTTRGYAYTLPLAILGPIAGAVIVLGGKRQLRLGLILAAVAVGVAAILSIVVVLLLRRPIWRWLDDLVSPLGLGVISHPVLLVYPRDVYGGVGVRPWGSTVIGGRHVEIIDTTTAVACATPPLKVSERGGRLVADSGPPWLAGLLDVPGPWDGISVHADGAAVRVSRRPSADTPAAAFLYDLALAERIAAAADAYRTG